MNDPVIEEIPGTSPDLAALLAEAGLPIDDLAEPGRRFFRFREGGALVGFIGWEGGAAEMLLRSLVVASSQRGRGAGAEMIGWALTHLAELGCTDVYILTTTIEALARRLGFARMERAQAPACVRQSRQFNQLCPATAVLLHRRLP